MNTRRAIYCLSAAALIGALLLFVSYKLDIKGLEPQAPQECTKLCEKFGGVWDSHSTEPRPVVRCNDNMFINEDSPEKCEPHNGVRYKTSLKPTTYCICNDGSSGYAE